MPRAPSDGDVGAAARILGLVEGDATAALSGVAAALLSALDRRLPVVGCIDYQPRGPARLALAAATVRADRGTWRARYHTSLLAQRALSVTLARRLRKVDRHFDLALQVHGWVSGQPRPYALYVDQTRLMAERGWPRWLPIRPLERSAILALERRMYAEAAHVLVMGRPARDSLIADYGVDERRVTVVGGGLMLDSLPPRREPVPEPTILFVGREFERKGGDLLLEAFAAVRRHVPGATLHVVGAPRAASVDGIVWHGAVADRRALATLYRSARVFCMPSRYEPYGLVFAEAMAHGVPCVGTEVQAIPEILDHGRAGLIVPAGDPEALASALTRLLEDDTLARELGGAGRARVERILNWEAVAARAAPVLAAAARGGRTSG